MENINIEKLINSSKQGDVKAFERIYNLKYDELYSRLGENSDAVEAAFVKMIATIGAVSGEKDVDAWVDKAVAFAAEQNIEQGKKRSRSKVFKGVLASKDAEIRFKLSGAKRFFAGLTAVQKSASMIVLSLVVIGGIVLAFALKPQVPVNDYQIEQTTLPGEKQVAKNDTDETEIEGLCVYSPDGESVYYSSDGCVRKMDREGNGDVVVAYGDAYSMIIKDKLLYFIANGKICTVNTDDDQMVNQVKTKGNLLVYTQDKFFALDTKNGIIYSLTEDMKADKTVTVKSAHIKYRDGYIYYYKEGDDSLIRQKVDIPMGKEEVISDGKDMQGMRFGYQISGNKAVVPTFDSDSNGNIIIYDMKSKKSNLIKLDHYFEDFALAGSTIFFTSYGKGTYSCDIDGKNAKKVNDACLYFVNASGSYYAFNNLTNGTTVLYSEKTGKFEYTIKADVDSMEILGDFIIYNCDGKMTKGRLSAMKNEA